MVLFFGDGMVLIASWIESKYLSDNIVRIDKQELPTD